VDRDVAVEWVQPSVVTSLSVDLVSIRSKTALYTRRGATESRKCMIIPKKQEMITVGVASVPERSAQLITVVDSLRGQADKIIIALNNYKEVPQELLALSNVECSLTDNSLADGYKFLKVGECEGYYFSVDDDLLYAPTYVQDTIRAIEKYHCIVTYHGKRFDGQIIGYHRSFTTNVRCLNSCDRDTPVHVGGSGVMAWHTNDFKFSINDVKSPFMADLWVSKKAHETGVKIMALAHKRDYFQYLGTPDTPIWNRRRGNQEETALLKSFLR
jgi:hypothetical protein